MSPDYALQVPPLGKRSGDAGFAPWANTRDLILALWASD
jgi:hypothetical protein